jgi:predicted PurR-regulated permease PerM
MNNSPLNPNRWLPQAISLSMAVTVYVILTHINALRAAFATFLGFFTPVLLAGVIAYLVNPLANLYRDTLFKNVRRHARRIGSNTLAFLTVFAFLSALLIVLVPQLIVGVTAFVDNLSAFAANASTTLPDIKLFGVDVNLVGIIATPEELVTASATFLRQNTDVILQTSTIAGKGIIQWAIAILLSIYLLFEKDRL